MVTTGKWRRKWGSLKKYEDPRIIFYGNDETCEMIKELKDIGVNISLFMKDAVKIHYFYCTENGMMKIYMPGYKEEDLEQTKLF